ncbi:VOC family protein [Aeromicrobium sp. 179-A 4D2 NHS]|uniref:VOC family protein n=1 Tax=Aeromicrobium sp. 179-A 4D2 NHS TaxID=3142375 RepID=UPI0039A1CE27
MRIRRAIPVLTTDDPAAARSFYESYLGFRVSMDEDGMLMFASPTTPTTQVIVTYPSPTAVDPDVAAVDVSIEVDDVDAAHREALAAGMAIVRDLRDEPWGVRRFFVRDPTGRTLNVLSHIEP